MTYSDRKEEVFENLLDDVDNLLEELFQSGYDTIHDSTMQALQRAAEETEQIGMAYLSSLLHTLAAGLAVRRHQIHPPEDGMAAVFAELNEYLYLCRGKIACDRGRDYYLASPDV